MNLREFLNDLDKQKPPDVKVRIGIASWEVWETHNRAMTHGKWGSLYPETHFSYYHRGFSKAFCGSACALQKSPCSLFKLFLVQSAALQERSAQRRFAKSKASFDGKFEGGIVELSDATDLSFLHLGACAERHRLLSPFKKFKIESEDSMIRRLTLKNILKTTLKNCFSCV